MNDDGWENKRHTVGANIVRFDAKRAELWIDLSESNVPAACTTLTLGELIQLGRWAERMSQKAEQT